MACSGRIPLSGSDEQKPFPPDRPLPVGLGSAALRYGLANVSCGASQLPAELFGRFRPCDIEGVIRRATSLGNADERVAIASGGDRGSDPG